VFLKENAAAPSLSICVHSRITKERLLAGICAIGDSIFFVTIAICHRRSSVASSVQDIPARRSPISAPVTATQAAIRLGDVVTHSHQLKSLTCIPSSKRTESPLRTYADGMMCAGWKFLARYLATISTKIVATSMCGGRARVGSLWRSHESTPSQRSWRCRKNSSCAGHHWVSRHPGVRICRA
jgi:hypothetical protein